MAGDRPRQPAHEIFSIQRRFLAVGVPIFCVQQGRRSWVSKMGTPLKRGDFYTICLPSAKTLADRHRCANYHNKQS